MGTIIHHTIVFTVPDYPYALAMISELHARAIDLALNGQVTNVYTAPVNGYRSFALLPDGSKEGWDASDRGDFVRKTLIEMAQSFAHEDGSNPVKWCEIAYGDIDDQ